MERGTGEGSDVQLMKSVLGRGHKPVACCSEGHAGVHGEQDHDRHLQPSYSLEGRVEVRWVSNPYHCSSPYLAPLNLGSVTPSADHRGRSSVLASGPRHSETGTFPFLCLGLLPLGTQLPHCEEAGRRVTAPCLCAR